VVGYWQLGLRGAFSGLALMFGLLFVTSHLVLRRQVPLHIGLARWSTLRPTLPHNLLSFVGGLAAMIQVQLAVYALAVWGSPREAGLFALTLQIYAFVQSFIVSIRSALLPIFSELEVDGELDRLRQWGGTLIRYGVGLATLTGVGWSLLGAHLLRAVLPPEFAPVYTAAVVILMAVILHAASGTCGTLLYVRGRPSIAASLQVLHSLLTVTGIVAVLQLGTSGAALRIAWVYVGTALVNLALAYTILGLRGGLWLPLRRSLLAAAPFALVIPALAWEGGLVPRLLAAVSFVGVYGFAALRLGLIRRQEIDELLRGLRRVRGRAAATEQPPQEG
jgi:O-antigen/teichoic acid export membrane protein